MSLWPELRASFRVTTGRELANSYLDEFLEHTLWYMVNSSDYSVQKREAIWKTLNREVVEGAEFHQAATTMMDQLDAFELDRTRRV